MLSRRIWLGILIFLLKDADFVAFSVKSRGPVFRTLFSILEAIFHAVLCYLSGRVGGEKVVTYHVKLITRDLRQLGCNSPLEHLLRLPSSSLELCSFDYLASLASL